MNLEFKTLNEIHPEVLHAVFQEAFSDYYLTIDLPYWKFEQFLIRRGFTPECSIGAFSDAKLLGFTLNAQRIYQGVSSIYDIVTGVIPEARQQGISSRMFREISAIVRNTGIRRYVLEVLKPNKVALDLYRKLGFTITREFACYKRTTPSSTEKPKHEVEWMNTINESFLETAARFWDWHPSWQNSFESVLASQRTLSFACVRQKNEIAGYGAIDIRTGDVPQLAVEPRYRRHGIARSLLAALTTKTESDAVFVLNIDSSDPGSMEFFHNLGFERTVDQFEMVLNFKTDSTSIV